MLGVDPIWVKPLPEDTPYTLPDTGGVEVVVLEANHCKFLPLCHAHLH